MTNRPLASIIESALAEARSDRIAKDQTSKGHTRFLDNRIDEDNRIIDDPHLTFFLDSVHRYLSTRPDDSAQVRLAEMTPSEINRLDRIGRQFYMEETQFRNLVRVLWLMKSFSEGKRDSNLYWLNKLSGLDRDKPSLEELARVRKFAVTTYECPGQIETVPELGAGYTALMALAAQTNPIVMLYGNEGSARNKHLTAFGKSERQAMYEARRNLLQALNFDVTEIDIPKELFSVPEPFARARAMMELGYFGSFDINNEFIDYVVDKETSATRAKRTRLFDVVANYKSPLRSQDYEALSAELRKPLIAMGMDILHKEGVYDIADIVLKAGVYKPKTRKKKGKDELKKEEDPDRESDARGKIWKQLLPSDLTETINAQLRLINPHFDDLGPDAQKQSIEYYLGEIIHIVSPLLEDPSRAWLKIGNETERRWDDFVYIMLESSPIAADAFWLFGDFFGSKNGKMTATPDHSLFGSLLYKNYTFLEEAVPSQPGGQVTRAKPARYTSYGIPATRACVSAVPLISDRPENLSDKFSRMGLYDADEVSRMVVGAIYSLMNPGDRTLEAKSRFDRNMRALSDAAKALPEPYQLSVRALDPLNIPSAIDTKIRAEHEVHVSIADKFDAAYVDASAQKTRRLEESIIQIRESIRENTVGYIASSIQKSHADLAEAIAFAEMLLAPRYKARYDGKVADLDVSGDQGGILDRKLKLLATEFFEFYRTPAEKRERDAVEMESFLNNINISAVYDVNIGEALGKTQEGAQEIIKQLAVLRESSTGLNERDTAIARGVRSKGEKLPGIGLGEYLDAAAETVMRLSYRRTILGNILALVEDNPDLRRAAQSMPSIIEDLDHIIGSTTSYFLTVVDRADMAHFLQNRFNALQSRIEQEKGDRTKRSLQNEINLLESIDQRLMEFEERYADSTSRFYHQRTVKFPHELQQFAAFRNAIATWKGYYQQAIQYIKGQRQDMPQAPVGASQLKSAYSITPEQATNFFSVVLAHLRNELGEPYFAPQRARAEAALR